MYCTMQYATDDNNSSLFLIIIISFTQHSLLSFHYISLNNKSIKLQIWQKSLRENTYVYKLESKNKNICSGERTSYIILHFNLIFIKSQQQQNVYASKVELKITIKKNIPYVFWGRGKEEGCRTCRTEISTTQYSHETYCQLERERQHCQLERL